jgi:hypothetical protein
VTLSGNHAPQCWYATQTTDPGEQVFHDHERLFPAASKSTGRAGTSWFDGRNDRLYVFGDPTGHVVEVAARD